MLASECARRSLCASPMKTLPRLFLRALIFLGGGAAILQAHETWLAPSSVASAPSQSVTFDLTSGGGFPAVDYAIAPERISGASFRLAGTSHELARLGREAHAFRFAQPFSREGVVTAWVTLLPHAIELKRETVAEYLDEINASPEVRAAWSRLKGKQEWKEFYSKHAKTCVAIGATAADTSWNLPSGQALELVPVTNPFGLRLHQTATFRLLANGKPLSHASVGLIVGGRKQRVFQTTDADGLASFTIDRAGKTLLFAVHLRLREDEKNWESDFATFTLETVPE